MNKKNQITFFILGIFTVLLVAIIIVTSSTNSDISGVYKVLGTPITWVQNGLSKAGGNIKQWFVYVNSYDAISTQLSELKSENDRIAILESENQQLEVENAELKELLGLKDTERDYELIAGNIIAEDVTDWFNTFTVDLGSEDGIKVNSPVITSSGLAGIIIEVGETSSKILTIVDEDNKLMCRISRTNELVSVRGVSGENLVYELAIDRTTGNSKIEVGDAVVTAESGGVYPKGIMVGTVKSVSVNEKTGTTTAKIEPAANLTLITKVYVMNYQ